jgi:hypothetical protein
MSPLPDRRTMTQVYDRFVITRSDQFYMCPYSLSKQTGQRRSFGKPLEFLSDAGVYVKKQLEYIASTENCKYVGGALDLVSQ